MADQATYVQRRRVKDWKKPRGAISCTRGFPWGNPYRDPARAAEDFAELLRHNQNLQTIARRELTGRILMCWCEPHTGAPDETRCHVQDVLIPFLNEGRL